MPKRNKVQETRFLLKKEDPKYTQEYVAHEVGITLGAYRAIENDSVDTKVSTALNS